MLVHGLANAPIHSFCLARAWVIKPQNPPSSHLTSLLHCSLARHRPTFYYSSSSYPLTTTSNSFIGKVNVLDELVARGLLTSITNPSLRHFLDHLPPGSAIYAGFDPTFDSLHIGHLILIVSLLHLHRAGLRPIVVLGGATGMIGDPSGRSTERPLLSPDQIAYNLSRIRLTLSQIFGHGVVQVVDNALWMRNMTVLDYLRDLGKHFRVNSMLNKESVQSRLHPLSPSSNTHSSLPSDISSSSTSDKHTSNPGSSGISYTEFSYQILQANDFFHLYQYHQCRIQLGGSDQWGNITAGIDLISRKIPGSQAYGITVPLLTTAQGVKFSKSLGNAVWLSQDRDTPFNLYQWAMRLDDADLEPMLKKLTLLPLAEIEQILIEHMMHPEAHQGHRILAREITRLVHGEGAFQSAQAVSNLLYGSHCDFVKIQQSDLLAAFAENGCVTFLPIDQVLGSSIKEIATRIKLMNSANELKRLASSGGFYVNQSPCQDLSKLVTSTDLIDNSILLFRKGKKHYRIVKIQQ